MAFRVVICGRPNVGKSTLFNRLVGRRTAIVDPTPGVTRDWREGAAKLGPLRFSVIDTAGLEEADPESLAARMTAQTALALGQGDLALLLVDGRVGLTRSIITLPTGCVGREARCSWLSTNVKETRRGSVRTRRLRWVWAIRLQSRRSTARG